MAFQGVVLVLPGGGANLELVRLVAEESESGWVLRLDELLVLTRRWQERALTTEETAHLIQKPAAEARAVLHRLLEAGEES